VIGIVILAGAYILSHFYRSFLAVLSPQLTAELGLGPDVLSDALGAWFAAFALAQFPVGSLLDRVGPRLTAASMFAVGAGGGGLLFASSQTALGLTMGMVMLGIGCAPVLMASVFIFKRTYSGRQFAMLTSSFIAAGLMGNIIGSSPLAWASATFGWRSTMVVLAIVTCALAAGIIAFVSDPPRAEQPSGGTGSYWDLMKLRPLWFIFPLLFVNYAVIGGLRGLWTGPYLGQVHGLDQVAIGNTLFVIAIIMAIGSLAYGPADKLFNSRKYVVLAGGSIGVLALAWWTMNPAASVLQMQVALSLLGFCTMYFGLTMAHGMAFIPDHLTGRGVTLLNFFNMGGVGVMQWLSSGVNRANDEGGFLSAFQPVLIFYVVALAVALAIYAFSEDRPPEKA